GEEIKDVSQTGSEPDPDGDGETNDNDVPTEFEFDETPLIGAAALAKYSRRSTL
ncbi:MAG: hypothetical protein F6K19_47955, partial [Cyanothece sp. SIO1E1]|nr:hypothetical protein [Cyanothece sp. SIO1E1]